MQTEWHSVDPDQTALYSESTLFAKSDLGLHCLLRPVRPKT